MTIARANQLGASGLAGAALMLAACSSGTSTTTSSPTGATAPTTPEPTVTVTASASPTPTSEKTSTGATAPAPPKGSKRLAKHSIEGGTYTRYSNARLAPARVVNQYKKRAQRGGYSIVQAGGSGGGWGGYGGSQAGVTAKKSDAYLAVQAGGSRQGATFFEVCVGQDKGAVDQCDNHSDRDSRSSGS